MGTRQFKQQLGAEHKRLAADLERGEGEAGSLSEAIWEERMLQLLKARRKTSDDILSEAKGVAWKVEIAAAMKESTTVSNPWLAARLHMGSPWRLSRLVSALK